MTRKDLSTMLECNQLIEWHEDKDSFVFRNLNLPGYQNNSDIATRMKKSCMKGISADDLLIEINRGMNITGITRVTGYFSMTKGWNPGKMAELKDRNRMDLSGRMSK